MRLGLLSDTHLAEPDDRFRTLLSGPLGGVEMILHAGDHVGDPVIEYLEYEEPRPYVGVAGNMDRSRLGGKLPDRRVLVLEGMRVGLIHGWGSASGLDRRVLPVFDPPVDVLVYGHSHQPAVRRWGGTLLVNPGSAFFPRPGPLGSAAILRLQNSAAEVDPVHVPV